MPQLRLSNAIADAVAADIGAMRTEGLFADCPAVANAEIVAKKKLAEYTLQQLSTLRINVTPLTRATTPASRGSNNQELGVLVLVTMKGDEALFGQLIDFVNDLDDLIPWRSLQAADRSIRWASSDLNPVYDIDVAYAQNVFRSLWTVNFQAFVN